jgi:hypothetical protein
MIFILLKCDYKYVFDCFFLNLNMNSMSDIICLNLNLGSSIIFHSKRKNKLLFLIGFEYFEYKKYILIV